MNHNNPSAGQNSNSRVIRVFISSTFRDMMQERDLLVKQVFPALRLLCAKRFVTFTEVDLRWGITEEQAAEGKVLPLCLAEIHRCRPYFLGLLGERYGWIPDTIGVEVIEDEPWLNEHLHGRTSVTELEILHGVLNNPAMRTHSFFYFRDPKWIDTLPETDRQEMIERNIPLDVERHGSEEASRRTQERKGKLTALKNRIRQSGLPVAENYTDPEALARMIQTQFEELIDQLYPEEDLPDALTREQLANEAHAKSKLFACINRPVHQRALNTFADSVQNGRGLVVTGESGCGKTVLLAAWARDRAKTHSGNFILQHYFGSTPESASIDGFLRRLLGELKRCYEISEDIPTEPDKLRESLPLWLAQTAGKGPLVLVLDGLNQIQGDESDRGLAWLPQFFQPHVTVFASTLPGLALDTLRERGWQEHDLPLADEAEIAAMVDAYLEEYRKTLDSRLRQDLLRAKGTKNPLFLRTILEELRQFGSFEELPSRVAHYLEADNPRDLFQRVLRRWQEDFDAGRDLVRRALSCLWAARMGLSESEWLDMLGADGQPLPRAFWTPLFLAMEPSLTQRAGLLAFGHDFIRQAVTAEYMKDDEEQRVVHLQLADYFEAQTEMTARKTDEWPWQLLEAMEYDRLQRALTDLELFMALYQDSTDVELLGYWLFFRDKQSEINIGELYLEAFASWEGKEQDSHEVWDITNSLGAFLMDIACFTEAESFLRMALELSKQNLEEGHPDIVLSLSNLGAFLSYLDHHGEAEPMLRSALAYAEHSDSQENSHLDFCLTKLAGLLARTNRLSEAEPLILRALEIREQRLGPNHSDLSPILTDLAKLLLDLDRLDEAEKATRRALEIDEKFFGVNHPRIALGLNNLAQFLKEMGRYAEAEQMMRRALKIDELSYGPENPTVAVRLNNLAQFFRETNRLSEAEPLMRQALRVAQQCFGTSHTNVATYLNNLGALLFDKKQFEESEKLIRRGLKIDEESFGPTHPSVARDLNNLAILLKTTNRPAQAEPLLIRALESDEGTFGPENSIVTLRRRNLVRLRRTLAMEAFQRDDFAAAREINEAALETGIEVASTRLNLGRIALMLNEFEEAANETAKAWTTRGCEPVYILGRMLWMWLALSCLSKTVDLSKNCGQEDSVILGQLKCVLQDKEAHLDWAMQPILDHIETMLSDRDSALLKALVAALSDREKLPALDAFSSWRDAVPRDPVDWPPE